MSDINFDEPLFNIDVVNDLCKGETDLVQTKIKAAYWTGCSDGMMAVHMMNSSKNKIDHVEDNVIFLKDPK